MDYKSRAVILGMCIGDAYLNVRKRKVPGKDNVFYLYESAEMRIVHSIKQLEYCRHKAELVRSILGGKFNVKEYNHAPPSMQGKSYRMCGFSVTNGYWKTVKHWLYPGGVKTYTKDYLDKCDLHSAALWYMDDGHLRTWTNANGSITARAMDLTVMCSKAEAEIIRDWFYDNFKVEWLIRTDPRRPENINRFLQINTKATHYLGNLMRPYIIPSMAYKIAHIVELGSTSAQLPSG